MANGFHIDGDGNLWIGSTSTNFDNNAAFYVKTDGEMKATSGEIGGLDIESNRIKSSSYSNTNSEGFQIHSDGTARFYGSLTANSLSASGANISGNITATDGTIGGTQINSSNIESTDFDANTGYQIGANSATFHDVTVTGTISGANIDGTVSGTLGTANSGTRVELSSGNDAGFIRFYHQSGNAAVQQTGTLSSDSGGLTISADTGDFLTLSSATGIKSFGPLYFYIDANTGYQTGGSGKVIVSDSNGNPSWGNVPANAGVTSIVTTPGNHITASSNTGTVNLVVNASNLSDSHNHTTTNAPGSTSTFDDDNHGNNHGLNMSNVLNSSSSGGGTYHSHTTSAVNAIFTAASSRLNLSNNSGSILINHLDTDHPNFGTGNGNGNGNGNSNVSANHTHDYAANSHGHGSSYLSNSHTFGHPTNHNHPYASNSHSHNIYALSTHGHGSNSPNINQYMHDDRFLNINANTVPGLNVINRLNPVTANFTDGYVRGLQKYSDPDIQHSFTSMDRKTYRLTVQDVEQALSDDGIDTSDVAWLVDRLYYADRYLTEEPEEKRAHGSRGLMNGELEAVLVQAIKDLSAKIDTLEDRIQTLEG